MRAKKIDQRPKSAAIYERLCEVIPGGVNSPVRACRAMGQLPLVAASGKADLVYDPDGNAYIDYCGSWGALIHGHVHPLIAAKAKERLDQGSSFGITTEIEELLARKIVNLVPSVEKIRFVSSGTEATMSAVRLARGFTGRPLVIKFAGNYHGHADFFLVKAGSGVAGLSASSSLGIPEELVRHMICLPFNDSEACRAVFADPKVAAQIAAVIIEPIAGNMGVIQAEPQFLELLRSETKRVGALLIFDEVMTGFRVGLQGAQGLYGITPDLSTYAKVMGGGFPAAAFGGRQDIMDCLAPLGQIYQAGTLSGNPVAMQAGLTALELLEEEGAFAELERKTNLITKPVQDYLKANNLPACIQQVGSMFTLFFGLTRVNDFEEAKGLPAPAFVAFFRYLFERGIYVPPLQMEPWFVSLAHTDQHLIETRDCVLSFLSSFDWTECHAHNARFDRSLVSL